MAHLLATGFRDRSDGAAEELVLLNNATDESSIDMEFYRVPSDAAFLKLLTPKVVSSNGARPRYMWAGREFESRHSANIFPAYLVTGFGLLDACMHAYATNATLVLHPFDIILSVCHAYGAQRKKPTYINNEELQKGTQIVLKQRFARSNLLLALVAKLARRVEAYPLPKLYGLINSELGSSDPFVMRLIHGILSYLATTRQGTSKTLENVRRLFNLSEMKTEEVLMESDIPTRAMSMGLLNARHDPNAPNWLKPLRKDANNQQVEPASEKGRVRGDPDEAKQQQQQQQQLPAAATSADVAVDDGAATNDMKIRGSWDLSFDSPVNGEVAEDLDLENNGEGAIPWEQEEEESVERSGGVIGNASCSSPPGAFNILHSDSVDGNNANVHRNNSSNVSCEREADDWPMKRRVPTRTYRFKKENGIHSVLFKGNLRAWLELPEILLELCQFFTLDQKLQTEITLIGLMLQKTRLHFNEKCRKWWPEILFKEGCQDNKMPDGDFLINGWLSVLLGDRVISEYCSMTINRLCELKSGVKLPMLLVQLPADSPEESDDEALDPEIGLTRTRLQFYDEYSEKLASSSSNAADIPVGLFLPWRSCEALSRGRKFWRQVGGDAPAVSRIKNWNNEGNHTFMDQSRDQLLPDVEPAIIKWSARKYASRKSGICSCCGSRARRPHGLTEPLYNIACLVTASGGFCLQRQESGGPNGAAPLEGVRRTCVRPLCFVEVAHEG